MRRVLLAGASLAVLLASANVKAAELVVSTDTPLSENVTFGTGQTYDSFSNLMPRIPKIIILLLVQEPPASI